MMTVVMVVLVVSVPTGAPFFCFTCTVTNWALVLVW